MISLLVFPLPAAAASPTAPQSPQWETVDTAPPGSSIKQVRGVSDDAGNCRYDIDLALGPNQDALYGRQIRHDPNQCITEVAELRGQDAIEAIEKSEAEEDKSEGATKGGEGAPKPGKGEPQPGGGPPVSAPPGTSVTQTETDVNTAAYINSQGHLRTLWEDPVDLTVAEVTNTVNWWWNNYNCLEPGWGSYRYYWYSPSGWELLNNNWRNYYWCDRQESSSFARFRNGAFCFGIDTYADWDRNWIWGYWDGWLRARWSTWVSGGCTDLLSFEYHFVRDKN